MSIPDRFLRIARYKMHDLKDWFDRVDEERETDVTEEQKRRRARINQRDEAQKELDDALSTLQSSPNREERPGNNGVSSYTNVPRSTPHAQSPASDTPAQNLRSKLETSSDPLAYHYRLLGLEPGADLNAVQTAYNNFAARCDPSRFPAGSSDQAQALQIRQRLDESFHALRDTLDATVRRFDLLEF